MTFGAGAQVLFIDPRLGRADGLLEASLVSQTAEIYLKWAGVPEKEINPGHSSWRIQYPESCVVCGYTAVDAVETACGHRYCRECLDHMCASAETPISCVGTWPLGLCTYALRLLELEGHLGEDKFDALLRRSLKQHVQYNPDKFRYCPTPNCPQVHRIWKHEGTSTLPGSSSTASQDNPPRLAKCELCLAVLCLSCETVNHDGLSCRQQKRLSAKAGEALANWKEANRDHVRDCPKCGCGIEINDGCAHMQCFSCKQHFCWDCLTPCESAKETEIHIQVVHYGDIDALND